MKRILLTMVLALSIGFSYAQTTYYWVGGTTPTTSITTGSNWNTSLDGLGTARPSSTGATDILVFNGANVGGTTPATGVVNVLANGSITCAQIKFINNANTSWVRATSGTSTITLSGGAGEDFVIEAGSVMTVPITTAGSLRFAMAAANSGRVSGTLSVITQQQFRFDNTTAGTGNFVFTNGSSFTTNITSASSSYAFGSGSQSAEKWVIFEDGAHLYYLGGYSPMGGTAAYSAIDFKPGSFWHHRANNGLGSFMNRKSFGNILVENNATLTADGSVYRINNLTIDAGSSFMTFSSGQTAIMGNITVHGTFGTPAAGTNEVILAGNSNQVISGSGTINMASLLVGSSAEAELQMNVNVDNTATILGKINFQTNRITGTASFNAKSLLSLNGTANTNAGTYMLTGNNGFFANSKGITITGAGIAPNTMIVSFSTTNDTVYVSQPLTASGTATAISFAGSDAILENSNTNGFDPVTGSVSVTGTQTFEIIHYIINAANTKPFGITTGSTEPTLLLQSVVVNADITTNKGFGVYDSLRINGKIILRPLDTIHVITNAFISGNFSSSKYIATDYNSTTGDQGIVWYEGISPVIILPIGTVTDYLPVMITPASASTFTAAVFQNITTNGTITGTPLTPAQKQSVVNAVWNINRLTGAGNADVQLSWVTALEGSTFTTVPSNEIGLITNTGSSWTQPIGTGDNTANTVTATISNFGALSVGALPPSSPFIFNPIPDKTYGDPDFNGGAVSLNTTQPILYSSSNTSVATIVGNDIHIVGAGTSDITASQASDGFYPSASVTRVLTVNPAALTISADNKLMFEGQPVPTLTASYSGFVLGENATALTSPAVLATTATQASAPGSYPITVSGATSPNYTISFTPGTLVIQAKQTQVITFNALPVKNYGNADFASGATSTNSTIPVVLTSSNTGVATINGMSIHIVGAGTTTITASQAGNAGYFPAADVSQTLTVNKVPLTVRVRDTVKVQGQPNPAFTITYTGFVLGENASSLTTAPVVSTIATTNSSPGYYTLTPGNGVSQNYNFNYVNGTLTILPPGGLEQPYINAFMSSPSTLTVRVYSVEPALGDIIVYDMMGRPLTKKNLFMPVGFTSANLLLPALPSGIYIVTVKGEGVDLKKTIPILK